MTAAGRQGGGQHEPERDERVTLPATERLARRGPGPALVAILVVAAFLAGVIRPWDWLAPGPASPGSGPAGTSDGAASRPGAGPGAPAAGDGVLGTRAAPDAPTPATPPAVERTCASPQSWRLAAIQDWGGRVARVWAAAEAVPADGPEDPRIPFTTIASTGVTAIGWCAPVSGPERPPLAATGTLFRLDAGGPRQLSYDRLEPAVPHALGELWMPLPQSVGRRPPWPPGRYVIRLAAPSGTFERYLGVEVVRVERESESTAPATR